MHSYIQAETTELGRNDGMVPSLGSKEYNRPQLEWRACAEEIQIQLSFPVRWVLMDLCVMKLKEGLYEAQACQTWQCRPCPPHFSLPCKWIE